MNKLWIYSILVGLIGPINSYSQTSQESNSSQPSIIEQKYNLDKISIEAYISPIAKIVEYSSSRHILAAVYGEEKVEIGDLVNLDFGDNKNCTLEVIDTLPEKRVLFSSTKDCPHENLIHPGMELKKSLISAHLGEKVTAKSYTQIRKNLDENQSLPISSLFYRPILGEVYGNSFVKQNITTYTDDGEDYELKELQVWQKVAYGINNNWSLGLSLGYQFVGEAKIKNEKIYDNIEGMLNPEIEIDGNIFKNFRLKIIYSPKIKDRDYDSGADTEDAIRGGNQLSAEMGYELKHSKNESYLFAKFQHSFKETTTVDGGFYKESGDYSVVSIGANNRFHLSDTFSIDGNMSYIYQSDELNVYYDDTSYIVKAHSKFALGTSFCFSLNKNIMMYAQLDVDVALNDIEIDQGSETDTKIKEYANGSGIIGLKYAF